MGPSGGSVRIRTPDQRLRVFVSSTLGELAAERAVAREAIEQLRLAPVMFETGARPHPPRDLYRSYLEQSDVFLGIYWQRYGWVAPDMEISGLEDEYRLSNGMPRLIYFKQPAPEMEDGLARILAELEGERTTASYRIFTTHQELGELVADDLAVMLAERFDGAGAPSTTTHGGGSTPGLPTGTLTYLFTDVEGSTSLWERAPDAMREALVRHDEIIDGVVAVRDGFNHRARGEGDSRFLVFPSVSDAVSAATTIQRRLAQEPWHTPEPLRVRMGLHTGLSDLRDGDYYGNHVNRAARIRGLAHGGQVVLSRATAELAADALPEGVGLLDLGEHGLRDLTRAERIHQLVIDGLPSSFPPLASLTAIANNLPVQTTPLIGRDEEVSQVVALLRTQRLVTLHAAGGTGKTRVALQVAAEVAPAYSDGAWFVSLAPLSDPDAVPAAIADAVGFPLVGTGPEAEQVLDYARRKHQLLVLDNFEHVRPAAAFVGQLLEAAPDLRILVTSRERLNLAAENAFPLDGLSWRTDVGESSEAFELFVDAARRRIPDWKPMNADRDAVARILAATQGMPLAVILAAAWVDVLPISEIAEEVSRGVDLLETEAVDVPDRHRSVRAAFEYSWRLLDDTERDMFSRLTVFRGGFDRRAAAGVVGASVRDLARLVGKSLLVADTDAGRYSIHELLRQLGGERLAESGQVEATRISHAEWMSQAAGELGSLWRGGRQHEALTGIASDLQNSRAAWDLALQCRPDLVTRDFALCFYVFHDIRGDLQRAAELFADAAASLDQRSEEHAALMAALCRAAHGWFVGLLGEPAAATALIDTVEPVIRRLGTLDDLAWATNNRNICLLMMGDQMRALADSERIADVDGDAATYWVKTVGVWVAYVPAVTGDLERGERETKREVARALRDGDDYAMIWLRDAEAALSRHRGDLDAARRAYEAVLALATRFGHGRATHYAVRDLGELAEEQGDLAGAEDYFLRSLSLAHELGQIHEVLRTLCDIARLRLTANEVAEALRLLAAVLASPDSFRGRQSSPRTAHEIALELVDAARETLPGADVDAALAGGPSDNVDVVVKELLDDAAGGA